MKHLSCALVLCLFANPTLADDPCPASSPDPAESPDGFGRAVGQPGETNSCTTDGGDPDEGDPASDDGEDK